MDEKNLREKKHRLNNILAGISGQAQLLLIRENLSDSARERLTNMRSLTDDIAAILTAHFEELLEQNKTSADGKKNE